MQSRAAESQKRGLQVIWTWLQVIWTWLQVFWTWMHQLFCICLPFVAWCTRFHCRSHPRNNRSCQFRAACISCVGNRCQGIQFCLQKPSNYLAEAVHRFCRCLTVATTVLDSSCLVMSVHVMFISLFWIWCQLFSFVTSWMSLAYSWTHLDSLDDVCNSFHSCHGFAVQLVDSFSLLCFWDVLETCCTWFERVVSNLN